MAVYKEDYTKLDLAEGVISRTFMDKSIGEGDHYGDRIGVYLYRGGRELDMTGYSCTGYFIREGNLDTVVINGTISGNLAYVALPKACYAYEGGFALAIKITDGSSRTSTVRIVDGVVARVSTDVFIDPGSLIPTEEELESMISRAEAAAEALDGVRIAMVLVSDEDYRAELTLPN